MQTRKVNILLHEDRTGPGIRFFCEAVDRGGGWRIIKYSAEYIPEISIVRLQPDLAVCNDYLWEGLVSQELESRFGQDFGSHLLQIFTRCCSDLGMRLQGPVETDE